MKGTLLLLVLLVTGELAFQTTEACVPVFETFISMAIGKKDMMSTYLTKFHATSKETEAMEKVQECFNKEGTSAKYTDFKLMEAIAFSSQCKSYYGDEGIKKIEKVISVINALGK